MTLGAEERALLGAIVAGAEIGTGNSALPAQLARKEVLERTNGTWAFQIPLIRRYVEYRLAMGEDI